MTFSVSALPKRKAVKALLATALAGAALVAIVGLNAFNLVKRAYLYGLPAYEIARSRDVATREGQRLNMLVHKRELSDHLTRLVTTPNNDTLYSSGFLDLSRGSILVDVPAFGSRYYSFAFIDAYTNNFAVVGQRTVGGKGIRLRVVAPGWTGEAGADETVVRAPTPEVWLFVRILIDGPEDLPAVHRLQDAIVVRKTDESALAQVNPPGKANGPDFVRVVNRVLRNNPPPEADRAELDDLEKIGIGANAAPLSFWQSLLWRVGFPIMQKGLIAATRQAESAIEGWSYARTSIGDFGTDYPYRAAVAMRGLLALPQQEAIYTRPVEDRESMPLTGAHRYRLHLPPGSPQVKAFWSLTAYASEPDGSLYFAANDINRYSIGDRTNGLRRNADGSIDLLVQHRKPDAAEISNWLPIPPGTFALIMRAYLPGNDLLAGRWRYPPLERLSD